MTWFAISGLINSVTVFSLGCYVYLKGRKYSVNKKYFLYCLSAAIWCFGYFLWLISQDRNFALLYCRVLMAGAIFIPVCFLDFVIAFLDTQRGKKVLFIGYLLFFSFFLLDFTPYFVNDVSPKLFFRHWPNPGWSFSIFLPLWFFYCYYGCYLLFKGFHYSSGIKRNQIKYILLAISVGYIGGATNYLLWYNIPFPPYGNFLIPGFAILMVYALIAHHLLDINIVFRRITGYSLTTISLYVLFIITLFLFGRFSGFLFQQNLWPILLILAAVASTFIIWGHRFIDRLFFKGTLPELSREKERIEEELRRSERLASIGMLATGLLHEIKNPLTPIRAEVELLSKSIPQSLKDQDFLQQIKRLTTNVPYEIDRITSLLKQLKEFARPSQLEIKQINIIDVLKGRLNLLADIIKEHEIELRKDYNCPDPIICADFDKLGQVFLNLFQNSIEVMPQGGNLTVSCESSTMPGSDKQAVLIKTQDTGFGIAKQDLKNVFDPFFTKKTHGTGLGLAVSHQIIKNHGGMIHVESEQGKGTTFYVYLPR